VILKLKKGKNKNELKKPQQKNINFIAWRVIAFLFLSVKE
jgi:hypothetical protein